MARKKIRKKKVVKKVALQNKRSKGVWEDVANPHAIVGFTIHKLFGYLDYEFAPNKSDQKQLARLAILYGLNGTGKTTILKLAYNMLSPIAARGHKSYVAEIPFKTFGVTLLDGSRIFAERKEATAGSYSLSVSRIGHATISHMFVAVDEPPRIPADRVEPPAYDPLMKALREVSSLIFYLADDRSLNVDWDEPSVGRTSFDMGYLEGYLQQARRLHRRGEGDLGAVAIVSGLEAAIHSLNRWFSLQVNRLSSTGFASAHSVYAHVIKQIVSPVRPGSAIQKTSLEEQIERLRKLAEESKVFEKYGLSSQLDVEPLVKIVTRAKPSKKNTLRNVLRAYLEALENRFCELRLIYDTVDKLITYLNEFLRPKIATFHLNEGLRLRAPNGEFLTPTMLSSGERHLLLILCCGLLSSDSRAIFIVDEPEISLNSIWQRKLLKSLLTISESVQVQFIMASHSIQLISGHLNHVVRLSKERTKGH